MRHGENGLVFKDAEELAAQLQVVGRLPGGLVALTLALSQLSDLCSSTRSAVVGLWDVNRWRKEAEASKIVSHPVLPFTMTGARRARHTHILLPPVCKDGSCAAFWGVGDKEVSAEVFTCALISDKGLVCPYVLVRTLKLHPCVDGNTAVDMYRETGFLTYKKCQVGWTQPEACSFPAPDRYFKGRAVMGSILTAPAVVLGVVEGGEDSRWRLKPHRRAAGK